MCCFPCTSFRGASYFLTSGQIICGLFILIKYSTQLFTMIWHDGLGWPSSAPPTVLSSYGIILLTLGLSIFRSIERESLASLKIWVGGLTLLQGLVLLCHLILLSFTLEVLAEEERLNQICVLVSTLLATFIHLTTLYLYMIHLGRRAVARRRRISGTGSGGSSGGGGGSSVLPLKDGRSSVSSSAGGAQRFVDGGWENLHQ